MSLYAIPPFALLIGALILAPVVTCGAQWLLHTRAKMSSFFVDNDLAGFIVAVVGTLYAVMLGFTTVQVWEHYETARLHAWAESASVADVWHDAVGLPAPIRTRLRNDMSTYAKTMINQEWAALRQGSFTMRGDELIMDAVTTNGEFIPRNSGESNAQASIMRKLNALHDMRANRLATNAEGISVFQWVVLWIGAAVVIGFCCIFSASHLNAHLVMTGAVSVLIVAMLVLIFELQYPFRSLIGISPAPWQALLTHIRVMDRMPGPMSM